MHNRNEWIVFLCVVVGIWYLLGQSPTTFDVQKSKTCLQWNESSILSNRCARSLAHTSTIKETEQRLSYLIPKEMIRLHDVGRADWYSLVLFPSIEYEVVRRCVFEGEEHPYCDSKKREEYHRLVDNQLMVMLASKNQDIQHRGIILACERSKKERILDIPKNASMIAKNVIFYTQLCSASLEERRDRLQIALKDDSLRSMALLSMISQRDIDVSVDDSWTPLEKSLAQGLQE